MGPTLLAAGIALATVIAGRAEDRLDPEGGEVVNGGEFVRFDEDGTDVKLGTFDSDEKRMKVGALVAGICTAPDDACGLDLAAALLHPDEYGDVLEIVGRGDSLDHFLANLYATLDNGFDADGDPNGAAGDGQIDRDEMSNRVYGTIRAWQGIDDDAWTDAIDSNDDGLVGFDEFAASFAGEAAEAGVGSLTAVARFNVADKNDDKWLSEVEVTRYRNPLWEGGSMGRWAVSTYLLELDSDENGVLSQEEYVSVGHGAFVNETRVPTMALEREFAQLDADLSDGVDLLEINLLPQVRLTTILSMRVNALFGAADTDKDGVLSLDELVSSGAVLQTYLNHTRLPDHADDRYDEEYGGDGDGDGYGEDGDGGGMYGGHDEF